MDARELVNTSRRSVPGLVVLADAFGRVAGRVPRTTLQDTLVARCDQIDVSTTLYAMRSLVVLACHQTGETPRSLLEAEFAYAPSDDFWRANLGDSA